MTSCTRIARSAGLMLATSLLAAQMLAPAVRAADAQFTPVTDMVGHIYVSRADEPEIKGWLHEGGSFYQEQAALVTVFRQGDRIGIAYERFLGHDEAGHARAEILRFVAASGFSAEEYPQFICEIPGAPETLVPIGISAAGDITEEQDLIPLRAAVQVDLVSGEITEIPADKVICPVMLP